MSVINPLAREISAKIVYYGPGLSGKTTSLAHIHSTLKPTHRGDLISLATEGDRTLYFDFLPVLLGRVNDLDVRLQLYTVPGQVFYGATRRLVLDGADGVVFVADSQRDACDRNVESLNDLEQNLRSFGKSLQELPFVIQYNKRDLPDCETVENLRASLNKYGVPDFETVASLGQGIKLALKEVTRLVKDHVSAQTKEHDRDDPSWRKSFRDIAIRPKLNSSAPPDDFQSKVQSALSHMAESGPPPSTARVQEAAVSLPAAPSLYDLGRTAPPPARTTRPSTYPPEPATKARQNHAQTIQAPAPTPLSFSALWEDDESELLSRVEEDIIAGYFAEAVYRAAGGVSDILDHLLGPHSAEGSATRAQLLGLNGHEYLELRRLGSRPASTITQRDALFALYVLISAHIKESRLAR